MLNAITIFLIDDDKDGGVQLRDATSGAIITDLPTVSLVGRCMNDVIKTKDNPDDVPVGGYIVHRVKSKAHRCDFTQNGKELHIKLGFSGTGKLSNAVFPPTAPITPGNPTNFANYFCIKSDQDQRCDLDSTNSLVKSVMRISDKELQVTLNGLTDSIVPAKISPREFSVNFSLPISTTKSRLLSVDPKIINKPREDLDLVPLALGISAGIGSAFFVKHFVAKKLAGKDNTVLGISILIGLAVGVAIALCASYYLS